MGPEESSSDGGITYWLLRWHAGDDEALVQLTAMVYAELRRVAGSFLRAEREGHTLQPTALVHELYLRISTVRAIDWKCRAQFYSTAARVMRNILVDHARRRMAGKRGAGAALQLDPEIAGTAPAPDILSIDAALSRFAGRYPRQAQVVELRFFGGLTPEETAEALNAGGHAVALRTVERDWSFAKAWLQNELAPK
ncbi:MAG: sigma-70 family RNA polymerase sigma factor [Bryobacteraceae bacterium]|jgi:RNA polymerase sigma factor (TIGR02999 family)